TMPDSSDSDETGRATSALAWIERDKAAAIVDAIVHLGPDGSISRIRIKLADKRAALVDLGRHFGMFVERKYVEEQTVDPAVEAELERRLAEEIRKLAERKIARQAVTFAAPEPDPKP